MTQDIEKLKISNDLYQYILRAWKEYDLSKKNYH